MSIYTTHRTRVSLLVDWKSVLHGIRGVLRQAAPAIDSPDAAVAALRRLRKAIPLLPHNEGRAISIDTLLFGGFISSDGGSTPELLSLQEGLPRLEWTGIVARRFHFQAISPVRGFRPELADYHAPGLFRPDSLITEAHLLIASDKCACDWIAHTDSWLRNHNRGIRYCPTCLQVNKETFVSLARSQQKLVDVLLTSYAFDIARRYTQTDDEGAGEVWICSTDADFVPVLATVRRWGLRTVWLQPQPNRSFGYQEMLAKIGVEIYDLPTLLDSKEVS